MQLPFTNNPEESFSITIFGVVYNMRQLWNTLGFWTLDIADSSGATLVAGIKLMAGINITKQYPGIRFNLQSSDIADPTRYNLDSSAFEVTNKDV